MKIDYGLVGREIDDWADHYYGLESIEELREREELNEFKDENVGESSF
jgi:hypothetical protein